MLPSSPISEAGFATRKELLAKFKEGWRLLPPEQHDYRSDDWAILVVMPTYPRPASDEEMQEWVRRFAPPAKTAPRPNILIAREYAAACAIALAWTRKQGLARAEAMA